METRIEERPGSAASAALRGAALSYRALFTWLNPLGYLSSRIVRPIGMAIAFISLSTYYGANAGRMLVASSLLAGAGAVVYGMALSIGNERSFGTLGIWLAAPQNKLASVCQRALPHIVDGFVGGLCTYLVCCLLYTTLPMGLPEFAGLLAVGVLTTAGFGLSLSALALVVEDLFVGPNMAELVLMVLSGTLVPQDRLPGFLVPVSEAMPLTHVMDAVERSLAGRPHGSALLVELLVGAAWFVVSVLFLHLAVRRASARAELGHA
ncbi:ABC transporter permease [Streptomyces sp. NBC_01408]|uniref:ABC transporter permease n=1 Tax=Streptomyces sp. NBC_01408 TaxID=2903855 RepID=UPI002257B05E|nr:ABC transporter permease [Streptomyces sp. NBC_01408]MCX4692832.1 ABC transporter permease [Streptomyces sp. NBC_01408]